MFRASGERRVGPAGGRGEADGARVLGDAELGMQRPCHARAFGIPPENRSSSPIGSAECATAAVPIGHTRCTGCAARGTPR